MKLRTKNQRATMRSSQTRHGKIVENLKAEQQTGRSEMFHNLCENPLIRWALTELRDESTPPLRFRELIAQVTTLLLDQAVRDFGSAQVRIVSATQEVAVGHIPNDRIIIVPIMRAGMAMGEVAMNLIPGAAVHHIGMKRDEDTLKATAYYENKPWNPEAVTRCIVTDVMLATGGSASDAIDCIKAWGIDCHITLVAVFAVSEGIQTVRKRHPDVSVVVANIDRELNHKGYILPGCGDAGDRQYGTIKPQK